MRFALPALLILLSACAPLPDTGADPATAGPPPDLVPLDGLLAAPDPLATAESATGLAARGAALKSEAARME